MASLYEERVKKYEKVTNLRPQINLNIAFDEIAERVMSEHPKAKIDVTVGPWGGGGVAASYDPETGRYTFTFGGR